MPSGSSDLQEIRQHGHTPPTIPEASDEYLEFNFIRDSSTKMETLFYYPAYYSPVPPSNLSAKADKYFEDKESEAAPLLQSNPRSTMYTEDEWATLACLSNADGANPVMVDLESQFWANSRSVPLAPQAPSHLSKYQKLCWYFSNRPRDSALAAGAVLIAILASIALVFLVFILFMQMTGQMGTVMHALDNTMTGVHKGLLDLMCVFATSECEGEAIVAAAAA